MLEAITAVVVTVVIIVLSKAVVWVIFGDRDENYRDENW